MLWEAIVILLEVLCICKLYYVMCQRIWGCPSSLPCDDIIAHFLRETEENNTAQVLPDVKGHIAVGSDIRGGGGGGGGAMAPVIHLRGASKLEEEEARRHEGQGRPMHWAGPGLDRGGSSRRICYYYQPPLACTKIPGWQLRCGKVGSQGGRPHCATGAGSACTLALPPLPQPDSELRLFLLLPTTPSLCTTSRLADEVRRGHTAPPEHALYALWLRCLSLNLRASPAMWAMPRLMAALSRSASLPATVSPQGSPAPMG